MLLPQIFKGSILCFNSGLCALLWTTTSTLMRQERTHSDAYEQRVLSTNTWGVFIVAACCSRVSTSLNAKEFSGIRGRQKWWDHFHSWKRNDEGNSCRAAEGLSVEHITKSMYNTAINVYAHNVALNQKLSLRCRCMHEKTVGLYSVRTHTHTLAVQAHVFGNSFCSVLCNFLSFFLWRYFKWQKGSRFL